MLRYREGKAEAWRRRHGERQSVSTIPTPSSSGVTFSPATGGVGTRPSTATTTPSSRGRVTPTTSGVRPPTPTASGSGPTARSSARATPPTSVGGVGSRNAGWRPRTPARSSRNTTSSTPTTTERSFHTKSRCRCAGGVTRRSTPRGRGSTTTPRPIPKPSRPPRGGGRKSTRNFRSTPPANGTSATGDQSIDRGRSSNHSQAHTFRYIRKI